MIPDAAEDSAIRYAYGPAEERRFRADVVVLAARPAAMMLIYEAALRSGGGEHPPHPRWARPGCAVIPMAINSGASPDHGIVWDARETGRLRDYRMKRCTLRFPARSGMPLLRRSGPSPMRMPRWEAHYEEARSDRPRATEAPEGLCKIGVFQPHVASGSFYAVHIRKDPRRRAPSLTETASRLQVRGGSPSKISGMLARRPAIVRRIAGSGVEQSRGRPLAGRIPVEAHVGRVMNGPSRPRPDCSLVISRVARGRHPPHNARAIIRI